MQEDPQSSEFQASCLITNKYLTHESITSDMQKIHTDIFFYIGQVWIISPKINSSSS